MGNVWMGGSLLCNLLAVAGFILGLVLVPSGGAWSGFVGALIGYAAAYVFRRVTLPKNKRLLELSDAITKRAEAENADRIVFRLDGVGFVTDGRETPVSMSALGSTGLRDITERTVLMGMLQKRLHGFYNNRRAYPPELKREITVKTTRAEGTPEEENSGHENA